MSDEVQLINDGDGIAVIGEPDAVERLLNAHDLPSKELGLSRLSTAFGAAGAAAQAGAEVAQNAGRWVKLTEKSAAALKQGTPMKGSDPGVFRAIVMKNGKTSNILEIVKSPASLLTNPAMLAGAAGIMTQLAAQQQMDQIEAYLAKIDTKVDDILRAQKDAPLADMIGVGLLLDETVAVRDSVGRVSDITWSKTQAAPAVIARTEAYAMRSLDYVVEKLEKNSALDELSDVTEEAAATVQEWMSVIARCIQLQDALAIIELDRVLDASPDELARHRKGLVTAREKRLGKIQEGTGRLLDRLEANVVKANGKVLLHPHSAPAVVEASQNVQAMLGDFYDALGFERRAGKATAKLWRKAAREARDRALQAGADGLAAAKQLGDRALDKAIDVGSDVASGVAERLERAKLDRESPEEVKGLL